MHRSHIDMDSTSQGTSNRWAEPDTVLSKVDPNEVNFRRPRLDKTGNTFSGVIDPSDDALAGLVKTILAEVRPRDRGTVVSYSSTTTNNSEIVWVRPGQGRASSITDEHPSRSSSSRIITRQEQRQYRPPNSQRSPFPSLDGPATTPNILTDRNFQTIFETELGEEIQSKVLQAQWPVQSGITVTSTLTVMGCIAVIYRNILRTLYENSQPPISIKKTFKEVQQLCGEDRKSITLYNYLSRDMEVRPREPKLATSYDKEQYDLTKILAALLRSHKIRKGQTQNANRGTFRDLVLNDLAFDYFWGAASVNPRTASARFDPSARFPRFSACTPLREVMGPSTVQVTRIGSATVAGGISGDSKLGEAVNSQNYRLMAVVSMRNAPGENDSIRIYDGIGRFVTPSVKPPDFGENNNWSLSEVDTG